MVEIIKVDMDNPNSDLIGKIAKKIQAGELVIYPTDTVYGLGTIATDDKAVEKVFQVKQRTKDKPISIAVDALSMAYYAGKITEDVERLIQEFLPGPLTIIVEKRPPISDILAAGTGKIGIRIPDNPIARNIVERVGRPITTTSANISGNPSPINVDEALDQIGSKVDLAIKAGTCKLKDPSTIVDMTGDRIELVREGPIRESDILAVL